MLDVTVALSFLGRSAAEPDLAMWIRSFGIELADLRIEDGGYTAYIERASEGFSLTFTDEAMFCDKQHQPIGQGPLYFSGLFLYSEGKDGYREYHGALPHELRFSDSRSDVVKRLGSSAFQRTRSDESVLSDRWDFAVYSLSVTYAKNGSGLSIISIFRTRQA